MRPSNEEEKKRASAAEEEGAEEEDDPDQLEEISLERWRQAQEQWRRDREQYRKELADKNAEVERLRAEVERFKRQRVERADEPMEEERKEHADAGGAQRISRAAQSCRERAEGTAIEQAKDLDAEQKEPSPCQVI